jgi:uncharacterized membrane protein
MLTLCGIVIVVAGFAAGINPLLVVPVAALATGVAAGLNIAAVVAALGHAFTQNRYVGIVWLVLPVIGLLERAGLREHAQSLIADLRQAITGRILILATLPRDPEWTVALRKLLEAKPLCGRTCSGRQHPLPAAAAWRLFGCELSLPQAKGRPPKPPGPPPGWQRKAPPVLSAGYCPDRCAKSGSA